MIKEIKRIRELHNLTKLIDRCVPTGIHIQHKEHHYYFMGDECLFIISDVVDVRYMCFLKHGISESITKQEIESVLYERFNIENKGK